MGRVIFIVPAGRVDPIIMRTFDETMGPELPHQRYSHMYEVGSAALTEKPELADTSKIVPEG